MNLEIIRKARKQIKHLERSCPKECRAIIAAIYRIAGNPFLKGTSKLTNFNGFRFRVGHFRIVYRVDLSQNLVVIISVAQRQSVYKKIVT